MDILTAPYFGATVSQIFRIKKDFKNFKQLKQI